MNPKAIAFMWMLTLLLVGAIALGPLHIYVAGGLIVAYTVYAVF